MTGYCRYVGVDLRDSVNEEPVLATTAEGAHHRARVCDRNGTRDDLGVGRNTDEAGLRDRTGGPGTAVRVEPPIRSIVVHVRVPGEGDKHIDVEERQR